MPRPEAAVALKLSVVAALLACGACPPIGPDPNHPDDGNAHEPQTELPTTVPELDQLAARVGIEGASEAELTLALRALERLETLQGEALETTIRQAWLVLWISEPLTREADAVRWLDRGDALAARVRAAAPDRVEGPYFEALFLGLRAQLQEVGGIDLLPRIVEAGNRAIAQDDSFDDAGPLRLMGMLLVTAPAWPHGVGDPEEGIAMLERAVQVSSYPLNRLLLGRALIENGQTGTGCGQLSMVLREPRRGRWARTGRRWRPEAMRLVRNNQCPRGASTPE